MLKILSTLNMVSCDDTGCFIDRLEEQDRKNNSDVVTMAKKIFTEIDASARQVRSCVEIFPQKKKEAIELHNRTVLKWMAELMCYCRASTCNECHMYFLPAKRGDIFCDSCWWVVREK